MKNRKRWLAGLLAAILVVNTWIGSAWAEPDVNVVADTTSAKVKVSAIW